MVVIPAVRRIELLAPQLRTGGTDALREEVTMTSTPRPNAGRLGLALTALACVALTITSLDRPRPHRPPP